MNKQNKKYKYIIWDWNGTIFNDTAFCVKIMNKILIKYNLPLLTVESYKQVFDFPVKDYYQKLGFDFEKAPFETVGTEFINKYNDNHFSCNLHKGITDLLIELNDKKYKQFVLSAREKTKLTEDLKQYNIYNLFIDIAGLNNHYANGKVEIGKKMIENHKIKTENSLLIGDTLHDAEVAAALNLDCLLIANGHQTYEKLQQAKVPVLHSAADLDGWF
jgi:phosphoglycolate phosphatase